MPAPVKPPVGRACDAVSQAGHRHRPPPAGKLAAFPHSPASLMTTRVLTGITTSGTPHLGNYVGAIRPAIAASHAADVESFYFLADYHALIKVAEPARVQRSTL